MVYVPFTKAQHVTNMQNVKKQLMEILPAPAKLTIMVMDSRTEPDVLFSFFWLLYYLSFFDLRLLISPFGSIKLVVTTNNLVCKFCH
jgi:hypothetical protein